MNKTAKILDPFNLPLYGTSLIEASAGTGKTQTIVIIYLRFLLKLGGKKAFYRELTVKELLVITFTDLATEELRNRIKQNIHDMRIACLRQTTNNKIHSSLLNEINDKKHAAALLLIAEQEMDKASIFTIHGICKHILNYNTITSLMLPHKQQFIQDQSAILYQACADFWRRHFYPLPRDIAEIIYSQWKGPEDLLKQIIYHLNKKEPSVQYPKYPTETLITKHKKIIKFIDQIKLKWITLSEDMKTVLESSAINRRKFNRSNQIKYIKIIDNWSRKKTNNYILPKEIKKFSYSSICNCTKSGYDPPQHLLFTEIELLLNTPLTLNDIIISLAIIEIPRDIISEKHRRGELSFDDMLNYLEIALLGKNSENLLISIRTNFPVAIIDEFQDTDKQQYRIFKSIWYQQHNTAFLLIGDPKQAIYSFRGADIHAYMKAKNEIKDHYTLETNWRSAPGIVKSINMIFQKIKNPFIFKEIPFLPVKSASQNANFSFEYYGSTVHSMKLWLMDTERCSTREYENYMAEKCALQIRDWLNAGKKGEAKLLANKTSNNIKASDITILVRNQHEALKINKALNLLNIPSVYLSDNRSIFHTIEAQEILWILQAILSPENDSILRCALASSIIGLNSKDIDNFNNDETYWDLIVEEFNNYHEFWKKNGVTAMLKHLISQDHIIKNILSKSNNKIILTNIMHINELLEEMNYKLDDEHSVINWLNRRINNAKLNNNIPNKEQIRLENNDQIIKIITIHKSKGMQYPIVWIPFVANYYIKNNSSNYNLMLNKSLYNLTTITGNSQLSQLENLAEDIRLLYVGLTRSIWHCSLGIAPIKHYYNKNIITNTFHKSALGYLIQEGKPKDRIGLLNCLKVFNTSYIKVCNPSDITNKTPILKKIEIDSNLLKITNSNKSFLRRKLENIWIETSYSSLFKCNKKKEINEISRLDLNLEEKKNKLEILTPSHFPRGIKHGTFLHYLFQTLDFSLPISDKWIAKILENNGYEKYWKSMISDWIKSVIHVPLTKNNITLKQINIHNRLVEVEFYLPIKNILTAQAIDKVIKYYDPISKNCPSLNFNQVQGMLKGVIDLIFRYNELYYLLDYKSNWLGTNYEYYTYQKMSEIIQQNRYDLQYHLYTLALHRYLRHRIINYNYEKHFGGVIYLFLRGISIKSTTSGIFITRPNINLINNLDQLLG